MPKPTRITPAALRAAADRTAYRVTGMIPRTSGWACETHHFATLGDAMAFANSHFCDHNRAAYVQRIQLVPWIVGGVAERIEAVYGNSKALRAAGITHKPA